MKPFQLHRPASLPRALAHRVELGDDAAFYAGGTELMVVLKQGLGRFEHLIDLKGLPGLREIEFDPDRRLLRIGALVRHRELELSPVVALHLPILAAVEREVANVRVRSTGTVGGNLCFAEPHSDLATLFLALGARIALTGPGGDRAIDLADLIIGPYTTSLEPGEIMTSVTLGPLPAQGGGVGYQRFRFHERPSVACCVCVEVAGGLVTGARVAVGCCEPASRRIAEAEQLLLGCAVGGLAALAPRLQATVSGAVDPLADASGSAEYKAELAGILAGRALARAAAQVGEGGR